MPLQKITVVALAIFLIAPISAVQAQRQTVENSDLRRAGIVEFEKRQVDHRQTEVTLFDALGSFAGEAVVSRSTESLEVEFTDRAGHHYGLTWNENRGLMILRSPDGRVGVNRFDLQEFHWSPNRIFVELASEQESTFLTMAAVGLDETDSATQKLEAAPKSTCDAQAGPLVSTKNLGTGVTCEWEPSCRGFGISGTRSDCCADALNDVHNCCTNTWCFGCCETRDCDASCGLGDYGCFCGQSGMACVGPRYY